MPRNVLDLDASVLRVNTATGRLAEQVSDVAQVDDLEGMLLAAQKRSDLREQVLLERLLHQLILETVAKARPTRMH